MTLSRIAIPLRTLSFWSYAGARAFRQAIDVVMHGTNVDDHAEAHVELKTSLISWGGKMSAGYFDNVEEVSIRILKDYDVVLRIVRMKS